MVTSLLVLTSVVVLPLLSLLVDLGRVSKARVSREMLRSWDEAT